MTTMEPYLTLMDNTQPIVQILNTVSANVIMLVSQDKLIAVVTQVMLLTKHGSQLKLATQPNIKVG